jgi:hypothetical protein
LAVVGFQSPEHLNWFRQANPDLQICLVTLWNHWALLWLKTDARPKNVVLPEGWIWLTRAAIPVSWPGQLEALIHVDGPVVQVCLLAVYKGHAKLQVAQTAKVSLGQVLRDLRAAKPGIAPFEFTDGSKQLRCGPF